MLSDPLETPARQAGAGASAGKAVTAECYPISILPELSRLFLDFCERHDALSPFYPASAFSTDWMTAPVRLSAPRRSELCSRLEEQSREYGAAPPALENIARLRNGAGAVVTGQQVTLFGGPLFTLFKAATAIRRAREASASGYPHVPVFWLATEDHDLAEADHIALPAKGEIRVLRAPAAGAAGAPVGELRLGEGLDDVLRQAAEILGPGPFLESLRRCYRPGATFGRAFAELLSRIFAAQGLIVIDASSRGFHALGRDVLRAALVRADELHSALADRADELEAAGYHAQVLTPPQSSLLFLIDADSGARLPLRRPSPGQWLAGERTYSTGELLEVLDEAPERLSPNALLRPVFQDAILPTAVYVGGPSEIAYFAQSQVLYERIAGRTTPVLPRLSATLIEPGVAKILARHEISLPWVMETSARDPLELAQTLGARALPAEWKRRLAAAGHALEAELAALTEYAAAADPGLARACETAASKMLYQMNRLRLMAANHQLQREHRLASDVQAIAVHLFPERSPQERVLGSAWHLSRYGEALPDLLVRHAGEHCPGHKAIWL